ncbi:hypothetical protein H0H92_010246 [Tricholoma furcatifolium]|nr:hypothetical protein H0H92_010246 [Tricholoma furcatifolium]
MSHIPRPRAPFRHRPTPLQIMTLADEGEHDHVKGDLKPPAYADMEIERQSRKPSLHRTSAPPSSILKRRSQKAEQTEDEFQSGKETVNRVVVVLEQIPDWIDESFFDDYRCPSCWRPCTLNAICPSPPPLRSPPPEYLFLSEALGLKSERLLSLVVSLLQHQDSRLKPRKSTIPSSFAAAQENHEYPTSTYTHNMTFDPNDEIYPETEHSHVLSSSLFVMDIQEITITLLSIAGLMLLLFPLLG